jgi:hypothetical protein
MSATSCRLIERLDRRNAELIAELDRSEFCRRYFDPGTPAALVASLTAEILREVHDYGDQLTRSICTAIGRAASHPALMPWMGRMVESVLDEAEHPDMAGRDSAQLDIPLSKTTPSRPSPAAFAVAGIARLLCEEGHPLSHLGFFYLLEGTNSLIVPRMQVVLQSRGIDSPFIAVHAREEDSHAKRLGSIITELVDLDPAHADEIEYGFDCLAVAYPMKVWSAALSRALATHT